MIIDDVRFELKDGREAILRSPKEEDCEFPYKSRVMAT